MRIFRRVPFWKRPNPIEGTICEWGFSDLVLTEWSLSFLAGVLYESSLFSMISTTSHEVVRPMTSQPEIVSIPTLETGIYPSRSRSILDDCLCTSCSSHIHAVSRPVTSPVLVRFYFATMTSGCELGRKRPAVRGQKHQTNPKNIPRMDWFFHVWSKKMFLLTDFLGNQHSILHYDQTFPEGAMFFSGEKVKSRLMAGPFWFCQVLLACKSYRRFSTWCVVAYANTQVRIVTFIGLWLYSPFLGIQKETPLMCGKITSATEIMTGSDWLWCRLLHCRHRFSVEGTQKICPRSYLLSSGNPWDLASELWGSWPTSERRWLAITTITKGIP